MVNPKFNLDKCYVDSKASRKAKELQKAGKKISNSLFYDKETAIYLSLSYNRKYMKVNSRLKVKPVDYDVKTQNVKTRSPRSVKLQSRLNQIKDQFLCDYYELLKNQTTISNNDIKNLMEKACGKNNVPDKPTDFYDIYQEFFVWKSRNVKARTVHRYESLIKVLQKFEEHRKIKLHVDDINPQLANELSLFLFDTYGYVHNTVAKYLKSLKCFSRYCFDYQYSINTKYNQIKSSEHKTSIFILEQEEIQRIANLKLDSDSLREIRDASIFQYYVACRFQDLKNIEWKDIVNDGKYTYLRLLASKTRETRHNDIPLLPEAIKIIKDRGHKKGHGDKVFRLCDVSKR